MKRNVMLAIGLLFWAVSANAQLVKIANEPKDIPVVIKNTVIPLQLEVSEHKTANLVFPYKIVSVDRGSRSIIVQKPSGVENILQVKAVEYFNEETNLSVVTADGGFYSFVLQYGTEPSHLNLVIQAPPTHENEQSLHFNEALDFDPLSKKHAEAVFLKLPAKVKSDQSSDMTAQLNGVFIAGDVLYFRLTLRNDGYIPYDVSQLLFYTKDKKVSKRMASQELALTPVIIYGETTRINAISENVIVVGIPKFTIPDKKRMHIQIMETNGGRHLSLKLGNNTIMKTKSIYQ